MKTNSNGFTGTHVPSAFTGFSWKAFEASKSGWIIALIFHKETKKKFQIIYKSDGENITYTHLKKHSDRKEFATVTKPVDDFVSAYTIIEEIENFQELIKRWQWNFYSLSETYTPERYAEKCNTREFKESLKYMVSLVKSDM